MNAQLDENGRQTLTAVSYVDGVSIVKLWADPVTHRLLVDLPGGGSGTVTSVSVVTANGFAGTVATATTTPAITLTTSITGILKGNATAISAATDGTDYLSSTTGVKLDQTVGQTIGLTGARLTKLWADDITVTNAINGSITGNAGTATSATSAATLSTPRAIYGNNFDGSAALTQIIASTYGGTGNGFTKFTGATTSEKTYTLPDADATLARTDAAQTFTGTQTFTQVLTTNNAITASGNAATVPITSKINTVTNNSAATLTITMTTTSATDGQISIVRILDFSAVAQTITWANTENSTVSAPTTSNGSTTLPLTVGFQYNGSTSKWRCIASA